MITRNRLAILACTSLIFTAAGCATTKSDPGTDTPGQAGDDIAGSYELVAVDGKRVPATVTHIDAEIKVESGVFTIDADGTCSSKSVFVPPSGSTVTREVDGSYQRNGSKLVMRWQGAGVTTGTVEGDIFTMNNHGMIFVYSRSGRIDESVDLDRLGKCDADTATAAIRKARRGVFDGFDSGLPFGFDCYGISVGYFTFRDSERSSVNISVTAEHPERPGEKDDNQVLKLDLDVNAWAGVIHNFENETADSWSPRDLSAFREFSFWLYGHNSGTSLFIDILDNRNPGSTFDDAERYTYTFDDNFSGWKKITVPFSHMLRKPIGNRAPDDGLGLAEVHGWGLGSLHTGGPVTYYLDDFELR